MGTKQHQDPPDVKRQPEAPPAPPRKAERVDQWHALWLKSVANMPQELIDDAEAGGPRFREMMVEEMGKEFEDCPGPVSEKEAGMREKRGSKCIECGVGATITTPTSAPPVDETMSAMAMGIREQVSGIKPCGCSPPPPRANEATTEGPTATEWAPSEDKTQSVQVTFPDAVPQPFGVGWSAPKLPLARPLLTTDQTEAIITEIRASASRVMIGVIVSGGFLAAAMLLIWRAG